jgi:hypothetical protein
MLRNMRRHQMFIRQKEGILRSCLAYDECDPPADAVATPWPLGAGQAPQDGVWEDGPVARLDVLFCM